MTHPQIGRALRLMNMEKNGTPTVAEFEALLTDQGRVDAFIELLQRPGALGQIKGYPNLMDALVGIDAGMILALSSASAMAKLAKSQAAMLAFLNNQSALDAIFASPDVSAAFLSSTALSVASVPVMTSLTAPSGVASSSSTQNGTTLGAFDNNPSTFWDAFSVTNEWIQYKFDQAVFIHTVANTTYSLPYVPKNCRIECSEDGIAFFNARSVTMSVGKNTISVGRAGFYKYWRVFIEDTYGNIPALFNLNFTGFVAP